VPVAIMEGRERIRGATEGGEDETVPVNRICAPTSKRSIFRDTFQPLACSKSTGLYERREPPPRKFGHVLNASARTDARHGGLMEIAESVSDQSVQAVVGDAWLPVKSANSSIFTIPTFN